MPELRRDPGRETLRAAEPAIDAFIKQCQQRRPRRPPAPRQTMFFFPGGMASSADPRHRKFVDGVAAPQTFEYELVWVDAACRRSERAGSRDAPRRRRHVQGQGRPHHRRRRSAVIARVHASRRPDQLVPGTTTSICSCFPWDWRRRLDETVTFFVRKFLPFFQARVLAAELPGSAGALSLVGHSFGGMIVNLILRGNDPIVANMTHVITVGDTVLWLRRTGASLVRGRADLPEPLRPVQAGHDGDDRLASRACTRCTSWTRQTFNSNEPVGAGAAVRLSRSPAIPAWTRRPRACAPTPTTRQTYGSLVRYPGLTGFDRCRARLRASPVQSSPRRWTRTCCGSSTTSAA